MSGDSRVWVEVEGRGYVAGSITVHDAGGEQSEVSLSQRMPTPAFDACPRQHYRARTYI